MSDEYGSHVDQKEYPRGTPYKKNPAIIDAYDPNEKPARPGEGARVSDVYGAHYRDPKYQIPAAASRSPRTASPSRRIPTRPNARVLEANATRAPRTPRRAARAAAWAGSITAGRTRGVR